MFKMLIADDEQLIRESLATCIEWNKYDVKIVGCCKNGIEALDAIIDAYPDIILTDIKMPGLTGLELVEEIRERDQDVAVILISGYKDFDYAKQAIRFGVTDYLLKPVKEELLIEAVENAKVKHSEKIKLKNLLGDRTIEITESSAVVSRLKKYVTENISDSKLTLKWVAENVLFMNVDYVSRRFLSETGEKFSMYLTRKRMEKAKILLLQFGKNNLHEIAVSVGCGNSLRYFGQLFKKHTGLTPTQYLREMNQL